jgi:peptidoglycan/LPS O-acetylase OafA/YrhL
MSTAHAAAGAPASHARQPHLAHPAYRPDIDGLRALAVLSVVVFHAFPERLSGGFIGVDVFFVISGFLISTIIFRNLEQGTFSFPEFYARRIRRIFPALVLVLASSYVFGWFVLLADEYRQLGKHIAGGAGFISNLVLWTEAGYFDASAETKPLLHLWSLGIEEQFYFVWPLLLWFAWKRRLNLFTLAIVVTLVSFGLNLDGMQKDSVATFYSPLTRFWELSCGALLAWTTLYKKSAWAPAAAKLDGWLAAAIYRDERPRDGATLSNVLSFCGLLLLCYGMVRMNRNLGFPGKWALVPVLGAVLVIAAGPRARLNRTLLSNPAAVWVGLISFPLYLWHWPLLSFARIVEGATPAAGIRAAAVLLAVALAWLTFRLVEGPLRQGGHGRARLAGLVLAMTVAGYVGYNTYSRYGLPFRPAQQALKINEFDIHYKESCKPLTGADFGNDWCSSGTSASRPVTTVMVGDSFASSYTTMLKPYAAGAGPAFSFIQFGRGGCPGLLGYGPAYCRQIAAASLDYARRTASVKNVVMAARWPTYYKGEDYNYAHVNLKESPEAFKAALEATLQAYRSAGKQVVMFLAQPTGSEPRACIVRPIRLGNHDACDLPLPKAREFQGRYRDYLLPLLASLGVPYFDPYKYLCNTAFCTVAEHGRILYADEGHLSPFGGEFLAQHGKNELDQLFRRQP